MKFFIKLIRPKQWIKNSFVLAPLIFSGSFLDIVSVTNALIAVVIFSVAASCVYILNDINDVEADRQHPTKKFSRPIAAGQVTQKQATVLLGGLYILLAAAWTLMPNVVQVAAGYIVLNFAYTFYLKRIPIADIFTVATCFVLRVYAGILAIEVPMSEWMMITAFSLALYLASIKRRQEIGLMGSAGRSVLTKYNRALINKYAEMSTVATLIFYSLYVVTTRPGMIITIPMVLYGLFRYWLITDIENGGESPTEALLKDRQLYIVVFLWVSFSIYEYWPAVGM